MISKSITDYNSLIHKIINDINKKGYYIHKSLSDILLSFSLQGKDKFNSIINFINKHDINEIFNITDDLVYSFYKTDDKKEIENYYFVFKRMGYIKDVKDSHNMKFLLVKKIPDIIIDYNTNDIKEKTLEDYEKLIFNILKEQEYININRSIIDIIKNFYFGDKKPLNCIIDSINNYKENDIFDIKDTLIYKIMYNQRLSIMAYINGLTRCGYITKISKRDSKYKIVSKIPENITTSDITQQKKVKLLQRGNKIKKILQ